MAILEIKNLSVEFSTTKGPLYALSRVNLEVGPGESVGLVGESGSGKSVTSLAVMQILANNSRITEGEIFFEGRDILKMRARELRALRGAQVSMIFQDPLASLNPSFTVENQLSEVLRIHTDLSGQSLRDKVLENLNMVGIPDPQSRLNIYPHQLSGGLAQRVMIAMAMACSPKLLIADEPTTALDVTIQAQILSLLRKLQREKGLSLLLISHDIGVISQNTKRMYVMYAGEIVETGLTSEVITRPHHPYTEALLECLPSKHVSIDPDFKIPSIPGMVPSLFAKAQCCRFSDRCFKVQEKCRQEIPAFENKVRCFFPENLTGEPGLVARPEVPKDGPLIKSPTDL
ncbi:MAG: ABC transporter ATP-binding protein [Bdellovibrionota bacterium]